MKAVGCKPDAAILCQFFLFPSRESWDDSQVGSPFCDENPPSIRWLPRRLGVFAGRKLLGGGKTRGLARSASHLARNLTHQGLAHLRLETWSARLCLRPAAVSIAIGIRFNLFDCGLGARQSHAPSRRQMPGSPSPAAASIWLAQGLCGSGAVQARRWRVQPPLGFPAARRIARQSLAGGLCAAIVDPSVMAMEKP